MILYSKYVLNITPQFTVGVLSKLEAIREARHCTTTKNPYYDFKKSHNIAVINKFEFVKKVINN